MAANNNQTQPQSSVGPVAQQLVKIQSNGHQISSLLINSQQPSVKQSPKKWKLNASLANKTLWDWLGVVLVPIMIAIFTIAISILQIEINQQQHDSDQNIALDQQRETTLRTYMDDIKDLLLNRGLRVSKPEDEVRVVARAETLSVLRQLDGERKGIAIKFLSEARLITSEGKDVIIDLFGAELSGAHLNGTYLLGVDLSNANLSGANLSAAFPSGAHFGPSFLDITNLSGANLSEANLSNADLSGADLSGADLSNAQVTRQQLATAASLQGATMPDGSIHP